MRNLNSEDPLVRAAARVNFAELLATQRSVERLSDFNPQRQERPDQEGLSGLVTILPTHVVTTEALAVCPEEHKSCAICLEEFAAGDEQRTLPCFHRFHRQCIDRWLGMNVACPMCKLPINQGFNGSEESHAGGRTQSSIG